MQQPVDTGQNTYWQDGLPSDGLRNPHALTGTNTYWLNGNSGASGGGGGDGSLFTLTNADTGKFFLLFD